MKKEKTLVVLAGGMGSRFGGLKQIEPVGPNGEFIIDYSVYDAVKTGFTKVVFVIREENYEVFKETIGKRVDKYIRVEYCFQKNDNLPLGYTVPESRVKPLGTAHALLCAKDLVDGPMAMINADDFYGRDAFVKASKFLDEMEEDEREFGIIGYKIANTLTENGSVKRGVCAVNEDNYLVKITESKVEKVDNEIVASPLNGEKSFILEEDNPVSMNFMLFNHLIFDYIEQLFPLFFELHKDELDTAEYLIPNVLEYLTENDIANTLVIPTESKWHGVTYREDLEDVKTAIKEYIDKGIYNNRLWD